MASYFDFSTSEVALALGTQLETILWKLLIKAGFALVCVVIHNSPILGSILNDNIMPHPMVEKEGDVQQYGMYNQSLQDVVKIKLIDARAQYIQQHPSFLLLVKVPQQCDRLYLQTV